VASIPEMSTFLWATAAILLQFPVGIDFGSIA